jgi:4-hydroxythreonine-4-phosphate dehydrogenase
VVLDVPLASPCVAGRLDTANARHVLALLDRATDGCISGEFAAMVTAPVQKSVINDAGVPFTGHTEYLAARTGAAHPVMLLAADSLRVALATTHLPLRAVSDAITRRLLDTTLRILDDDVRRLWGISRPRIAVCGLNPHAGESGHLGTEDRDVIRPPSSAPGARGHAGRRPDARRHGVRAARAV